METIEEWIDSGIARVILGTVAVRDPELVRRACVEYPGRIAVGIDAKGGKVAVEGWAETSELTAEELAKRFEDAGVCRHHLHRHRARRHPEGPQPGGDGQTCARDAHPRHRLRRPRLDRRRQGAAAPRVRDARRRHHRPRPVRWPHRPEGGARPHRGGLIRRQHLDGPTTTARREQNTRAWCSARAPSSSRFTCPICLTSAPKRQSRRRSPGRVKCGRKQRLRFASTPWRWSPLRPASVSCLRCCCAAEAASRRLARRARGASANGVCSAPGPSRLLQSQSAR